MPHESRLHSGDSIPHYHIMSKKAVHEGGTLRVPINWMRKFFIESIYRRLSKSPFYDAREVRAAAYACSLSSLSQRRPSEVVLPTSKWLSVLLSVRNRSERSFSPGSPSWHHGQDTSTMLSAIHLRTGHPAQANCGVNTTFAASEGSVGNDTSLWGNIGGHEGMGILGRAQVLLWF